MDKIRKVILVNTFSFLTALLLYLSFILYSGSTVEAAIVQTNPFWMPLEFDIGTGYFKANVFIAGLKSDTGLLKICVTSNVTNHKLCHYMDAAEEEGQIISSGVSAHAGIFVFPSSQVPPNSNASVCLTVMKDEKTICKTIYNSGKSTEELVDLSLKS
jgi:hypothetical protein